MCYNKTRYKGEMNMQEYKKNPNKVILSYESFAPEMRKVVPSYIMNDMEEAKTQSERDEILNRYLNRNNTRHSVGKETRTRDAKSEDRVIIRQEINPYVPEKYIEKFTHYRHYESPDESSKKVVDNNEDSTNVADNNPPANAPIV